MAATSDRPSAPLRRGWTTGACAAAATKAAYAALLTGQFPDPVTITLPKGESPSFPLAVEDKGEGWAMAGIVKDAGDDPDVTHGCTVVVTLRPSALGTGVTYRAGEGVGTVTKEGLPIPRGEPAINPMPRQMIAKVIAELGGSGDVEVEISIPGGAELAEKTWNPRLGIVGGLSILGTTGIVHPFSCSAWIASIHRGVDVARAQGIRHVAGCTGSTSEDAVRALYDLPLEAMIDMGDFVGGLVKYVRDHPVERITIGGGFGKMVKLAQGALDLHSARSQVDLEWFAAHVPPELAQSVRSATTAAHAEVMCREAGFDIGPFVAGLALETVKKTLRDAPTRADVVIVARTGEIVARAG
jgi:cobalt-precorrin-5B (C1)-methyltransferase